MVRDGMGESIVKQVAWGNQSTNMLATYNHITNETIMDAVAEKYGIKKPETREEKKVFEPIQCPTCGKVNPPGTKYCGECMQPLTEEAIRDTSAATSIANKGLESILQDPDKLAKLQKLLESL